MREKKIEKDHCQGVVNKVQDCLPNCLTVMSCPLSQQVLISFYLCHVVEFFTRCLAYYRAFRTCQSQFLFSLTGLAMRTWCSINTICSFFVIIVIKTVITAKVYPDLISTFIYWCTFHIGFHIQSRLIRGVCSIGLELCPFDLPFPHVLFFTHLA